MLIPSSIDQLLSPDNFNSPEPIFPIADNSISDFYEDFNYDCDAHAMSDVPLLTIAEEYSAHETRQSNKINGKNLIRTKNTF